MKTCHRNCSSPQIGPRQRYVREDHHWKKSETLEVQFRAGHWMSGLLYSSPTFATNLLFVFQQHLAAQHTGHHTNSKRQFLSQTAYNLNGHQRCGGRGRVITHTILANHCLHCLLVPQVVLFWFFQRVCGVFFILIYRYYIYYTAWEERHVNDRRERRETHGGQVE